MKWTSRDAAKKNKHHNNEGSRRIRSSSKMEADSNEPNILNTHIHTDKSENTYLRDDSPKPQR